MIKTCLYAVESDGKYLKSIWNGFDLTNNILKAMLFGTEDEAKQWLKCKPIRNKNPQIVKVNISYYIESING